MEKHRELIEDERSARSENGRKRGDPELARVECHHQAARDEAHCLLRFGQGLPCSGMFVKLRAQ